MIDRRVDLSHSGKVWIVLAGLAAILYVLWQLSNSIAVGSTKTALLLGAAFAAFFIAGRILGDWRSGVYFFFVWLLFEDLIRKYMGNSMYVYFAKDALVGVIYMSMIADRTRRHTIRFRLPFRFAMGAFVILGLVQVFNPLSPSMLYGLLGLKLYFYYVPLMFVGYAMVRNENDLRRFLVVSMVLAAVISLVGILQTIVGQDFLNPHNSGAEIEELGHLVRYTPSGLAVIRPSSVFVSDGRFAEYLILAFILGLGTAGYLLLRSGRGGKFVFPALGLVALATILSGARGAFVFMMASGLVIPAGMLWGAPENVGATSRLVRAIRRSFIFVVLAVSLSVILFPDVVGAHMAFYRETLMPDSETSELGTRVWDYPLQNMGYAFLDPNWVLGHGIGTASLGVEYVSRIMGVPPSDVGVENGFGVLMLELGILGPILWLAWAGSLVFAACRIVLRLKGTWAFPIALAIAWFSFLLIFPMTWQTITQYQNFSANAYFWLLVGVLFRLPELVNQNADEPQVTLARTS
jgi:hypothetical protein